MPICPRCHGVTTDGDICQYCRTPFIKPPDPTVTTVHIHNYAAPQPQAAPPPVAAPKVVQSTARPTVSTRSWWVTMLLCTFIGFYGVHRYYSGKIGTGLIWTFSAGCLLVGWIIDFARILRNDFYDKQGRLIVRPANVGGAMRTLLVLILIVYFIALGTVPAFLSSLGG